MVTIVGSHGGGRGHVVVQRVGVRVSRMSRMTMMASRII